MVRSRCFGVRMSAQEIAIKQRYCTMYARMGPQVANGTSTRRVATAHGLRRAYIQLCLAGVCLQSPPTSMVRDGVSSACALDVEQHEEHLAGRGLTDGMRILFPSGNIRDSEAIWADSPT